MVDEKEKKKLTSELILTQLNNYNDNKDYINNNDNNNINSITVIELERK